MLRYVINWKWMIVVLLISAIAVALQFGWAHDIDNSEVTWTGDCVPTGLTDQGTLTVKCYDDGPEITDDAVTRAFVVAALAGRRIVTVSCVVRRLPVLGSLDLVCEPPESPEEE